MVARSGRCRPALCRRPSGGGGAALAASGVQSLEVVSNRADLVSGGDALVAARSPTGDAATCASTSTAPT